MMTSTSELLHRADALVFADRCKEVSSRSLWSDLTWRLDTKDPGYGPDGVAVRWWPGRADGELPSPTELAIIESFKRLAWIGLFHTSLTFVSKVTGMQNLAFQCSYLTRFMAANDLPDFSALTPEQTDRYVGWIADRMTSAAASPDSEPAVRRGAFQSLLPLVCIWKARRHLRKAGVPVPAVDPLRGRSALDVAKQICDWAVEALPAVPEEAFVKIVNAATDIVTIHSRDVLAAQDAWFAQTGGTGSKEERRSATRTLAAMTCETVGMTDTPWPRTLLDAPTNPKGHVATVGLSRMITTLRDACVIVLLATTGLRLREIVAIPGGRTIDASLPDCLTASLSLDGLIEVFNVTSRLTKGQITPLESSWLVGSRPAGIGRLPLGAMAIDVLERLMAPWRPFCRDQEARSALMVHFHTGGMPRRESSLRRITVDNIAASLHEFYRIFAGLDTLPDRSADLAGTDLRPIKQTLGRCIFVRQYRKNYAQYLLRIDSGLLPAIRTQLHHMRIATTQLSYTGNDPRALGGIDDEQRLKSTRAIASLFGVRHAHGGRLAELISDYEDVEQTETVTRSKTELVEEMGFALVPGEHGWCGIAFAPHLSRCNGKSGSASFLNPLPDAKHRNPTTCSGCALFAFDATHRPFWFNRWKTNRDIWEEACAKGLQDDYRVAENRMRQAAAFLKNIGKDV